MKSSVLFSFFAVSVVAVFSGCGDVHRHPSETVGRPFVSVPLTVTMQEALIGTWSWDNKRAVLGLECWIPPANQAGRQLQDVTFLRDGDFTLRASHEGMPNFIWHGRWALDQKTHSVKVTMDDLPEPSGAPKIGIKATLVLYFSLDNELKEWILFRPLDAGYLVFLKRSE